MHATAADRDPETVMTIAFDKAGALPIDFSPGKLPTSRDSADAPDQDGPMATSVTAATCEHLALFAGTPGRDESDNREIWDSDEASFALNQAIRIMVEGITTEGTQLYDERESLLWGFANMLHRQAERLERTVDKIMPELRDLEREQDGSDVLALKLQTLTERARNLGARAEAFKHLLDIATDA